MSHAVKKESTTQYAILGALSVRPMSGYAVRQWITETTGTFWSESLGQIYPTLTKLLEENYIKVASSEGVGNRPRKIYKITSKGQRSLDGWLKLPAKSPVERNELVFKMFYGKNLSKEEYLAHLYRQKQAAQDQYAKLKIIEKRMKDERESITDHYLYWSLTLRKAFLHCEAEMVWCDDAIKVIKRNK